MVQNNKTLKEKAKSGEVYFGPLSAFIVHAITGHAAIDESIAGRTLMYDLHSGGWSQFTLDYLTFLLTAYLLLNQSI